MTLHLGDTTKASTPISKRAPLPNEESASSGGFWAARMVMAFTLVGLGIGTAFLIELPQRAHSGPAPALPAAAAVTPSPAPPAIASAPELGEAPGTSAAAIGSSPLAPASTPGPGVPAPSAEPPRSTVAPRKSFWKPKPKKKPAWQK